jgi:hypothetical protein
MFLDSDGQACTKRESQGVSTRFLNATPPVQILAKCKDSGHVKFNQGNAWVPIGRWRTPPLP